MPGPGIALCPACGPCMPPYTWGGVWGMHQKCMWPLYAPLCALCNPNAPPVPPSYPTAPSLCLHCAFPRDLPRPPAVAYSIALPVPRLWPWYATDPGMPPLWPWYATDPGMPPLHPSCVTPYTSRLTLFHA